MGIVSAPPALTDDMGCGSPRPVKYSLTLSKSLLGADTGAAFAGRAAVVLPRIAVKAPGLGAGGLGGGEGLMGPPRTGRGAAII
jgi:hypothetical protein